MLLWETIIWKCSIKIVDTMVSIIRETGLIKQYKHNDYSNLTLRDKVVEKKILIRSSFKLNIPIIAFTKTNKTTYII